MFRSQQFRIYMYGNVLFIGYNRLSQNSDCVYYGARRYGGKRRSLFRLVRWELGSTDFSSGLARDHSFAVLYDE
jgi:hypothetical protein